MRRTPAPAIALLFAVVAAMTAAPAAMARPAATDEVATMAAPAAQQPTSNASCDGLVTAERRLEREVPNLEAPGPRGRPRLCLLYYPREDIYSASLHPVDSVEQFRAAKDVAVRTLQAAGFDVCGIGTWLAAGRFPPGTRLTGADRLDLPVQCRPRVVPRDAGAVGLQAEIEASLARVVDATADQFGWRPTRPLTVLIFTDTEAAVESFRRYIMPPQTGEALARRGASHQNNGTVYGGLIELTASREIPERNLRVLAHEYTHFAQSSLTFSAVPQWFLEGQAAYQEARIAFAGVDHFSLAAAAARNGTALRLAELTRGQDWVDTTFRPNGTALTYSHAWAVIALLVERHGFAATVQLLRANRDGGLEQFFALLASLTGMDIDTLDAAVTEWLLGTSRTRYVDPAGRRLLFLPLEGGARAEGVLVFDRPLPCAGSDRSVPARTGIVYGIALQADGRFAGGGVGAAAVLALESQLTPEGELQGTFQYRTTGGCDSGPVPFTAHPQAAA